MVSLFSFSLFSLSSNHISIMGMLFLDLILLMLANSYLERVVPSEFGTTLPWYFPFQWSYWFPNHSGCCKRKTLSGGHVELVDQIIDNDVAVQVEDSTAMNREPVSDAVKANLGMSIRNLTKRFGSNTVVKGINLDIYNDQILALLGHNGAGKSTTINMLIGLIPPTSGDALMHNMSILSDMHKIRQELGVCPQHDVLWDNLTVREHLTLYCHIKGVQKESIEQQVVQIVNDVGLSEKIDIFSGQLSGGMKRKLSVGIALIGNSSLVFLDEPTSGMDPYSRRATWQLLKAKKAGRTIVLTTHFMDEADGLGDRIAIMSGGEIKCVGSSLFLKNRYGVGYTLTLSKTARCDTAVLSSLILSNVPTASQLAENAGEISFRLPMHASGSFPGLFEQFDRGLNEYGISSYGISVTTLEEVFLKVGAEDRGELKTRMTIHDADEHKSHSFQRHASFADEPVVPPPDTVSSASRFSRNVSALFIKRFHDARRSPRLAVLTFILPTLILLLCFYLNSNALNYGSSRTFDTNIYNDGITSPELYSTSPLSGIPGGVVIPEFGLWNTDFQNVGFMDNATLAQYLLDTLNQQKYSRYGAIVFGHKLNSPVTPVLNRDSILFNTTSTYALPIHLAEYHNIQLRALTSNHDALITTRFQFFPPTLTERSTADLLSGFILAIAFSFIPAAFVSYSVREDSVKAKHAQFVAGVSALEYWTANYLFDFINYLIPASLCMMLIGAFKIQALMGVNSGATILVILMYGFSVISFSYMASFLFTSHVTAQNAMLLFFMLVSVILLVADLIIRAINVEIEKIFLFFFRLLPSFSFSHALLQLLLRPVTGVSSNGTLVSQFSMDVTGFDLLFMALEAVVYFSFVMGIEYFRANPKTMMKLRSACRFGIGSNPEVFDQKAIDKNQDDAVRLEQQRVVSSEDMISVRGLRKVYPNGKVAVENLYLGIPEGECFGFLGVNGAGKTTTMTMLTNDAAPTCGTAHLHGLDITTQANEIRQHLGYCPQFDSLIDSLTAREHLVLYARIRGVPKNSIDRYVEQMIQKIGLQKGLADQVVKGYSGGNKRKLCVGIALIGNPSIVFLDEPSTGMDPASRRQMWNLISSTMSGRSVILTTHSMEECEALCGRIGIMVNGILRCIGTAQELKARYGAALQLDLHIEAGDIQQRFQSHLLTLFPGLQVLEFQGDNVKYSIPKTSWVVNPSTGEPIMKTVSIGQLFASLEQYKHEYQVKEYSVSEVSLESIFIHFARQQYVVPEN